MKPKHRIYEVIVEMRHTETVTFGVSASSEEEALQKAKDFDYADIDFDHFDGSVEYFWEDADVVEA